MLHSPCLPVSYFFTYLFKISRKKLLQTHRFTSFSIYSFYFFILKSKIISLCMKIRINLLFTAFSCGKQTTFFIQGCHILYIWARIIYAAPAISTKMGYWIFFREPHAKRWSPNACPCRYSIPASLQQRRDMLRKSRSEQQLSYFRINAITRASGPMCVPIAMPISCRLQPVSPNCCTVSSINCCPISALSLCANMTGIAGSAS